MKPDVSEYIGKVGKIIGNTCNHEFTIGTRVTLFDNEEWEEEGNSDLIGISIANPKDWWYLKKEDVEVIGSIKIYAEEEILEYLIKLTMTDSVGVMSKEEYPNIYERQKEKVKKWWKENK